MINKKKKILWWFGALSACIIPIVTTISCGSKTDQDKINGITAEMVKTALGITPSSTTLPSAATKPATKIATLNGLVGVTIAISDVTPEDNVGTLKATIAISKIGLTSPKPFTITWSGYQTKSNHDADQKKMNGITSDMVKAALGITPSSSTFPSEALKPSSKTNVTLNGLAGITITINSIKVDNSVGEIEAIATISKTGLESPPGSPFKIIWDGYLSPTKRDQRLLNGVTNEMVKAVLDVTQDDKKFPSEITKPTSKTNVTLNSLVGINITVSNVIADNYAGTLTATAAISRAGLVSPKPFIIIWTNFRKLTPQEKMDAITSQMIKDKISITPNNNIWADEIIKPADKIVTINNLPGVTIHFESITPNIVAGSLSASVSVSKTGLTPPPGNPFMITWQGFKNSTSFVFSQLPGEPIGNDVGQNSSIQKISSDTLLVGTNNQGFYWVNISGSTWKWTSANWHYDIYYSILSSGNSSIKLIAPHKCLIGTFNKGYFLLDTISKEITKVTPPVDTLISDLSSVSSFIFPLEFGKNVLVWTNNRGLFNVDISTSNWKWTLISNSNISNNSGVDSNIIRVDNTHLLVSASNINSSNNSAFYKVDISTPSWTWTKEGNGVISDHSAINTSMTKVSDHTLLVGTAANGFFKVDTSKSKWVWTKIDNKITHLTDSSGMESSSFMINKYTILVGTHDKGFYKVYTFTSPWTWIPLSSSNLTMNSGYFSSIEKVINNTFIVGTYDKKFQKVVTS